MQKTAWTIGAVLLATAVIAHSAPSLDIVLGRLDAYLFAYEKDLSTVIADEAFEQEIEYGRAVLGPTGVRDLNRRTRRRLTSEIAFFWLNGEMDWLGFRSVMRVDGKPVDRPGMPLKKLLEFVGANSANEVRWIIEEASKHNLGNPRTINTPNLPLDLLHRRNRPRFHVSIENANDRVNGRSTVVLRFDEFQAPTIVRFGELGDLESHVRAWVDNENGALWRAEVRLKPRVKVSTEPMIRVEFRRDKTLGILVPVELDEEFIAAGRGKGHARYSNFRRFETNVRIVPPQ